LKADFNLLRKSPRLNDSVTAEKEGDSEELKEECRERREGEKDAESEFSTSGPRGSLDLDS